MRGLAALVGLGLVAAALSARPWAAPELEALGLALRGVAAALVWGLACVGLGGALLGRARLAEAFALGAGVLGVALLPLVALGLAGPWSLAVVAALAGAGWLRRPEIELPGLSAGAAALGLVVGGAGLLAALAPATDTDEVYQHLALPARLLMEGALDGGPLYPNASRPLPVHLVTAGALALGGQAGAKLLHLAWAGVLLLAVRDVGARRLSPAAGDAAALLLLGSYTVVRELGLVYNNLPTALWVLVALDAALEGRWRRMATFAGMALAAKYTAAPAVVGVFLVAWAALGWRSVPKMAGLTALALAWVAPWWLRNALEGFHPLFPYAGWEAGERFTFVYTARYGVGRGPVDLLLLPWNMVVHASVDDYRFLGQVSPAGLACLPAAAWALRRGPRAVAVAAVVGFVDWAAGAHWLRYLLPAAPLVALALGQGFAASPRWGRAGVLVAWLAGLPANWGPWLAEVAEQAPVALGRASAQGLLERRLPGYTAARFASEELPEDAVVALLFSWPDLYVERPVVLGSVEDHVPVRHWLFVQGEDSLDALRARGVTHVLAQRVRFVRKGYEFLPGPVFREQFEAPAAQAEALLLREGTLEFEDGRFGVWRLLGPASEDPR